jgi:L-cystine uptake protein TcyP (sodium:dicarboxylate symporter family)
MTTRREKSKPQKPQMNKQLEAANAETEQKKKVNQRQEKLADFLIDVAKYVFTGVIITSLFNDVSDKTTLYVIGMAIVVFTLLLGLSLTSKRKDK